MVDSLLPLRTNSQNLAGANAMFVEAMRLPRMKPTARSPTLRASALAGTGALERATLEGDGT